MSNPSFTRRFFAGIGRLIDALRTLLGRLLFLVIVVIVLVLVFSGPETVTVPNGATLVLAPKGTIVEQQAAPDPVSMLVGLDVVEVTSLQDLLDVLHSAAEDDRINSLVLQLDELVSISPAHLEIIGEALEAFKASGKPVLAHGDAFSQAQYALASYANTVNMHPMGNLLLQGYGGNQLFFAGLLEKLKVNMHVFRVGTHKAAAEPFTRSDLSPEARENNQQLVDEFWARYLETVAANRGLEVAAVRRYANEFPALLNAAGNDMAELALQQGLVDSLQERGDFYASTGMADNERIRYRDYLRAISLPELPSSEQLGLIVAQGTIVLGEEQAGMIGSDSLVRLIRQAREDDSVRALVLRIDSPGGVALASELIRAELQKVREAGKPVIVSMGSTAASGGYWIATAADQIWASATTVTGSIGVIGMVPSFEDTLAEAGISTDGVGTTPLSRGGDLLSGLNPAMAEILQANVENGYRQFLTLVAQSRDMTLQEVDAVAQGKVWSGARAVELGLVDEIGGLEDSLAAAAELAGLDDWQLKTIAEPLTPAEAFLQQLAAEMNVSVSAVSNLQLMGSGVYQQTEKIWQQLSAGLQLNSLAAGRLQLFTLCESCLGFRNR